MSGAWRAFKSIPPPRRRFYAYVGFAVSAAGIWLQPYYEEVIDQIDGTASRVTEYEQFLREQQQLQQQQQQQQQQQRQHDGQQVAAVPMSESKRTAA